MKPLNAIFILSFLLQSSLLFAQLEGVIVEKYYISDIRDATNSIGGRLDSGSVIYRIFINLAQGNKLLKIYGDADHALKFSSNAVFFNHTDRGESFGKDINDIKLNENTLALDSWLTLGFATKKHLGILKTDDTDGSIVGGMNNDGGSENYPGGLLVNADTAAGIPLTTSDGLIPATYFPSGWVSTGFKDGTENDTTVFGGYQIGSSFVSNSAYLKNSGITGATSDNIILAGQLTTKGNISFELNIEIEENHGGNVNTVQYVAKPLNDQEKSSPYLTYPMIPKCGCKDSSFVEFKKNLDCHIQDSCKTAAVLGCMDPLACNYDPKANINVPGMCCFPGYCNDRSIRIVCPGIEGDDSGIEIYPNPAQSNLFLKFSANSADASMCIIYDSFGNVRLEKGIPSFSAGAVDQLDVSSFPKGLYLFRLFSKSSSVSKMFVKQ